MKKLLIVLCLVLMPGVCFGAAYLTSDETTENVTKYVVEWNGVEHEVVPESTANGVRLHWDVTGMVGSISDLVARAKACNEVFCSEWSEQYNVSAPGAPTGLNINITININ